MLLSLADIEQQAKQLPADERASFVKALLESLKDDSLQAIQTAWRRFWRISSPVMKSSCRHIPLFRLPILLYCEVVSRCLSIFGRIRSTFKTNMESIIRIAVETHQSV